MLHSLPYVYVHVYFQSAYIVCCLVCVTPVGRLEACFAFVLYHFFSVQHQGKGFVISAGITKAGVWIFLYLWMQKEEFRLISFFFAEISMWILPEHYIFFILWKLLFFPGYSDSSMCFTSNRILHSLLAGCSDLHMECLQIKN